MRSDFLVDVVCGRLVSYLRMCGYDTVYAADRDLEADAEILAAARADDREILTRDVALANRAAEATLLESRDVEAQLAELRAAGVDLTLPDAPTRCGACNGPLERVGRDATAPERAPDPDDVPCWRCRECEQWFWRGSHWDRVRETLSRVRAAASEDDANGQTRRQ